jgi:transcriptional regulator GlxA family with amidase domain
MNTAILIFDDAEELDFMGPYEVFAMAAKVAGRGTVQLVAEHDRPVKCAKKMRVLPDLTFGATESMSFDVVLVPGGDGRRAQTENPMLIDWLRETASRAKWATSVCTGAFLLNKAGLLAGGKQVTTHWSRIEELRKFSELTVLENIRYVRDGKVLTGAGVSAGIDLALWLVGQEYSVDIARQTRRMMEYDPAPPYSAEV